MQLPDATIDHQGESYYLHASVTRPNSSAPHRHCVIVVLLCTVQSLLGLPWKQCHLFQLDVDFPAIVTDCGGNVAKAFNTTLQWDWLCCGCHLIHNVVNDEGLESLKNHAANPAQATAAMVQEALDKSVLLSFSLHCCTNDLPIVPDEHVCNVLHS